MWDRTLIGMYIVILFYNMLADDRDSEPSVVMKKSIISFSVSQKQHRFSNPRPGSTTLHRSEPVDDCATFVQEEGKDESSQHDNGVRNNSTASI
jgi:hypothetical protein